MQVYRFLAIARNDINKIIFYTASDNDENVKSRIFIGGII